MILLKIKLINPTNANTIIIGINKLNDLDTAGGTISGIEILNFELRPNLVKISATNKPTNKATNNPCAPKYVVVKPEPLPSTNSLEAGYKMKYADKLQIPYVIIVGEDEIDSGIVKIRNMETGEEKEWNYNESLKEALM